MTNKNTTKKRHSHNLAIILTIIGLGIATTTGGAVYATETIDDNLVVTDNVGIETNTSEKFIAYNNAVETQTLECGWVVGDWKCW